MKIFNANINVNNIRLILEKLNKLKEKNLDFYSKDISRTVFEKIIIHYLLFVDLRILKKYLFLCFFIFFWLTRN